MDLKLRYVSFNRYVITQLRELEKSIDGLISSQYNPLHKWRVGNLFEIEIKNALLYFYAHDELSDKIRSSEKTIIAFSILHAAYKEIASELDPETLSPDKWISIRNLFEQKTKEENENDYGKIQFEDKIGLGSRIDEKVDEEKKRVKPTKMPSSKSGKEKKELDGKEGIQNQIEEILDNIYVGDWVVKLVEIGSDDFNYQLVILNRFIEAETLKEAKQQFTNYFPGAIFQIKEVQSQSYIEGFMN